MRHWLCLMLALVTLTACRQTAEAPAPPAGTPGTEVKRVTEARAMGGAKSVTTFFITSVGLGRGGNLGGLQGADAHCRTLANADGMGDHTWRAYLSVSATGDQPAVNARDRIGKGPWYNAEGTLVAADLEELHGAAGRLTKETAVTQRLDPVNGVGDTPNQHDILTGSRPDGTAFPAGDDRTCGNWTSSSAGHAQVGHHDRKETTFGMHSWNSSHASQGCSPGDLESTGGAGLFYCFGID